MIDEEGTHPDPFLQELRQEARDARDEAERASKPREGITTGDVVRFLVTKSAWYEVLSAAHATENDYLISAIQAYQKIIACQALQQKDEQGHRLWESVSVRDDNGRFLLRAFKRVYWHTAEEMREKLRRDQDKMERLRDRTGFRALLFERLQAMPRRANPATIFAECERFWADRQRKQA